ncbi:uncharacterized protein LOC121257308 [Juglans microcarpa x Juglans regia]|uniref:uncharacterized protein LOC121257308 n=1 Tax=Juglans microcarpa x Juglans regia TaxID=2249226 RepID=UPI001B7E65D7|nr:uncharacterized protein LOC121257308 [Juglans microcarpa x Juglans regia]
MAVTTGCRFTPALPRLSSPVQNPQKSVHCLLCPSSFKPISPSKPNPSFALYRSRTSRTTVVAPKRAYRILADSGLVEDSSEKQPESEPEVSGTGAHIDIKLPRRSLLVQFTCDLCGERTKRLVNRLAYERGLIYVQCAGCLRYHKLVDNIGLIVEYDLQEKINMDSDTDQL